MEKEMKILKGITVVLALTLGTAAFAYTETMYVSHTCTSENTGKVYHFGRIAFSGGGKTEFLQFSPGQKGLRGSTCRGHTSADVDTKRIDVYMTYDVCGLNIKMSALPKNQDYFVGTISNKHDRLLDTIICEKSKTDIIEYETN